MSWDDEFRKVVKGEWDVGESFTLGDVDGFESHFSDLYPDNAHVRDKLRQILQHLRDEGTIKFVDNDRTYRRVR